MIGELIIVAVALVTAVVYSTIICRRKPAELWPWTSNIFATLISVLLGVAVALALFKYTNVKVDAGNRERFRHMLNAEMSDTFRILSSGETMAINIGDTRKDVLVAFIQPLSIEKAAQSGLFDEAKTENLLHLARKMRMYNLEVQYLLGAITNGRLNEVARHASDNVESTRQAVLSDIRLMTKQLELNLSPSIHSR